MEEEREGPVDETSKRESEREKAEREQWKE
jgi:hypothetical protein